MRYEVNLQKYQPEKYQKRVKEKNFRTHIWNLRTQLPKLFDKEYSLESQVHEKLEVRRGNLALNVFVEPEPMLHVLPVAVWMCRD